MLGRPFGVPGDSGFQRRVLTAALRLLAAPAGPVLEDYAEDAPRPAAAESEGIACPVTFESPGDANDPGTALAREIEGLAPWHDLAAKRRTRTTTGLSGMPMDEAAAAQPGNPDAEAILHWFWRDTAAGRAFLALQKVCLASSDKSLRLLGSNSLVPRAIMHTMA